MLRDYYDLYPSDLAAELEPEDRGDRRRFIYPVAKRGFDIAVTLILAPFAVFVVGVLALLIRLDGGNPFFAQQRVGKGGRIFKLWKLQTMVPNDYNSRISIS